MRDESELCVDAANTERNSAVREAQMWLQRTLSTQRKLDQAQWDLYECEKSHAEWERAYDELLCAFRRLEIAYQRERCMADVLNLMVDQLQPIAATRIQNLIQTLPDEVVAQG